MYCAWRISAHLRCTQCSILLRLMDICFLTCICLWQISQIQTCLFKVVGPGLVWISPAFVSSSTSNPAGPHGWHAPQKLWTDPAGVTASQIDGEAGWWTAGGKIGLPPLARVMGGGRQQQQPTHYYRANSLHVIPDKNKSYCM